MKACATDDLDADAQAVLQHRCCHRCERPAQPTTLTRWRRPRQVHALLFYISTNIRLIRESQHQNALDDYNSMVKPGLSWNAYLVNLDTKHDILFLQAVKKTSCHLWLTGKEFLQT
jgi:hypothetical protein